MKHILSIIYTTDIGNFDQVIKFRGESIRLTQYATNFDLKLTLDILQRFDGLCDAISISGLPPKTNINGRIQGHPERELLMNQNSETHVLDGQMLKEVYIPWVLRKFLFKNPNLIKNQRVGMYSGLLQKNELEVLEQDAHTVELADPYLFLGLPFTFNSDKLNTFYKTLSPLMTKMKIKRRAIKNFKGRPKFLSKFFSSDVFVGNMATFELIDLEHLFNKIVITDVLDTNMKRKFEQVGVTKVLTCLPQQIGIPFLNFAIFEALLQTFQKNNQRLTLDDILSMVEAFGISPEIIDFDDERTETDFHFLGV